ncbi:MAG TPA: hypothetical protein VF493_21385, partial [Terriglobales bacterium]
MASHFRFPAAALRPRLSLAVGLLLFSGTLVAQDSAELNSLLGKIPRGSHYDAVAVTHAFDLKVSRNPEDAVRFLQGAANLGDPSAQTSLGYLYAMGT